MPELTTHLGETGEAIPKHPLDTWRTQVVPVSKSPKPRAIAAPLHQAVSQLQTLNSSSAKKAELGAAVDTFLDVYTLSQHVLRLPRIDRALPTELPEGVEVDTQKVFLGDDAKGTYVGLVQRRKGRGKQVPDTP